jgi:hypothetical protein
MLRTLAISTLLFLGSVSAANADVYRWVDDHAGVHYTDRWVPGSVLIKTTKAHPSDSARSSSRGSKASSEQIAAQLAEQNAAKAVKQDTAKMREQQCKDAKERYEKAIQARRIYKAPEGGEKPKDGDRPDDRQYMSDEEADAYRVKARTDMQEVCGPSGK